MRTLVVEAKAKTLGQDPQIVWKNLSSTATLTYTGGPTRRRRTSHGPKVIPPTATYDTARYGDRPVPGRPGRLPRPRARAPTTPASGSRDDDQLARTSPGSTFNLYQEMSYGQLFPHGTVPSAGIATAGWDVHGSPASQFTEARSPSQHLPRRHATARRCRTPTGTPLYAERINDGWYQLPGDTDYYGGDANGSALIGAVAGVGALQDIDSACGPTGKAVYDAAQIADPEIDYSDYDTDKDGVVDFFMMVFAGLGGNGASQLERSPPYDNIWPHSSSLEFYYTDPDDRPARATSPTTSSRTSRAGRSATPTRSRTQMTTERRPRSPVYVRVGPYNVNPETAIDKASVISHEYGHSLGLPDFYSTGSRETYGDWNLMATDKSQNMDVFGKQELGWVVPRVLEAGHDARSTGWQRHEGEHAPDRLAARRTARRTR